MTQAELQEYLTDFAEAFSLTVINEEEYRGALAKLGLNATDIEEEVRRNRPPQ